MRPEPAAPHGGWPDLLATLLRNEDLTSGRTAWVMDQVMRGCATPAQLAGFLMAMRAKGETVAELEGLAEGMLRHAVPLDVPGPTLDIAGTGGDGARTVNVSTMSAIVAAGAGATVVKHGNRAASSSCGSADVLEHLGVVLELPPARIARLAHEVGIAFCFAPAFHPAMRRAGLVRQELGVPTVFNALGPLTNPAGPRSAAVGVADPRLAPLIAGVLARRGCSALVFRGDDGLDELSVSTTSRVWVVAGGQVVEESFDPREIGIGFSAPGALRGADAEFNAGVTRRLLAGERGPVRDAVLLSAGAALAAAERGPAAAAPLAERLRRGAARAAEAIDSGAAADVLARWVRVSAELVDADRPANALRAA